MSKRSRLAILIFFLILSSCKHKEPPLIVSAIPAGPPDDEIAYQDGLKAFREATPEGYQRAVDAFRKAATLRPSKCQYALHLSESLFFLAQKRDFNWDEWQPLVQEANTLVLVNQGEPDCATQEPYLNRLRALNLSYNGGRVPAVAMINKAIEQDPKDPMNWIVLAQMGNRPSASDPIAPILHAAELGPDLPVVQYELGNYYLGDQATYGKAKQAFDRALELSPQHYEAVIGTAYSLWLEGDDAGADQVEPLLLRAVQMAPKYLRGRSLLGDYYSGLEETEKAVQQYQAAVAANATYYPVDISMGTTLMTAELPDSAETAFNDAVALDLTTPHPPRNSADYGADCVAHSYLGDIWFGRNDMVRAMSEYKKAVQDIVSYAPAYYGMGAVFHREGLDDDALKQFDKVIQLSARSFPNAYLSRGGIKAERGQFPAALSDLDQAVTIYQQQIVGLKAKIQADDLKGRKKLANGERRRQAQLESILAKAIESKKTVEAQVANHPAPSDFSQ